MVEYLDHDVERAHGWSTFRRGFEAEASWSGPVETVDAAIPLAVLPGLPLVVGPPGREDQDATLRWHLVRPHLAALPPTLVGMDHRTRRPARLRAANLGYAFSASSTLRPEGRHRYGADQALDGDGGTAWCEGVPGSGIGQYLEVRPRLDPALAAGCRLQGFAVVPGVALSKELWLANNRAVRLRISSCAHLEVGVDVDLEDMVRSDGRPRRLPDDPRSVPDFAQYELEGDILQGASSAPLDVLLRERECFRLTILGVKVGRVDDTCIGEFVPLVTCREEGYSNPIRPVP